MMFTRRFALLGFALASLLGLVACSTAAFETASEAPASAAAPQNMQAMMAAMQGMMSAAETTPPSPEMMQGMMAMMGGMEGMMGAMAGMDPAEREAMMAQMQTMMADLESMPMMGNMDAMEGMEGMMEGMDPAPAVPAGLAYLDGQEMRFIHTEVSDPDIAQLLSDMMDSPVLHVPSLADAPEAMLAPVYVFTNGVEGMGPLGFQPDVFDNPPGAEGYTPLRSIRLVTWVDGVEARELKAAADVLAAEQDGEVTIESPGVVVNMPFITWPGGER